MASYLEVYCDKILNSEIGSCEKVKTICKKLKHDIHHPGKWHFDEEMANKHVGFIQRFCKTPSGKIGTSLKLALFQVAWLQAIFGFVDDDGYRQYNEVMIMCGRKNGKALALDTEIPTPEGFKTMEQIDIGDEVYGADGLPHKVIATSGVFYDHDCYKVTFQGGYSVVADADHLWHVRTKKGYIYDKPTKELLHFKRLRKDGKGTEYLYRVPAAQPVQYSEKELPIDPYTLGAWLGDGSSRDPRITKGEQDLDEIIKNIEEHGHSVKIHYYEGKAPTISIDTGMKGQPNKFLDALRDLNVIGNKHIPDIYLHSSIEQRKELLKGLMDTDGYCAKSNHQCEFCQKRERFTDQFRELLSSLGIVSSKREKKIRINGKICTAYSVLFFVDKEHSCFKLKRKHEQLKDNLNKRMEWRSIIDIQKVDSVPCKCIAIDSEDKLYLATRNYIVTHNTTLLSAVMIDMLVNDGEGSPQIVSCASTQDQSKLSFNAALKMIKQSPDLSKHIRKRVSDLYFAKNFGTIKALSGNHNALDGLDIHCCICDELAAWKERDTYDLMKQATGARKQPLIMTITTAGYIRESIGDAQYAYASAVLNGTAKNDRFLPFIYELDNPDEWLDESCYIKANPGLHTIKSMEYMREVVQKAKDDPSFKNTVLCKEFDIPQTEIASWLPFEAVVNEEVHPIEFYEHSYAIGSVDLSAVRDLTAAVLMIRRPNDSKIYILAHGFIPQAKLDDLAQTGTYEAPYKLWQEQGWLTVNEGAQVDYSLVTKWFLDMVEKHDIRPLWVGYDRAMANYWSQEMQSYGFDMIPVAQGPYTWTYSFKSMGAAFMEHRVVYDNNPVVRWCLCNTAAKALNKDGIESVQPVKIQQNRRIDLTVAILNAWVVYDKHYDEFIPYLR